MSEFGLRSLGAAVSSAHVWRSGSLSTPTRRFRTTVAPFSTRRPGELVSINPFGEIGSLFVLVDDEEQYSLWPTLADVPAGWRLVHGEADRAECLDCIEQNWTDIRAASLRDRLAAARAFDS